METHSRSIRYDAALVACGFLTGFLVSTLPSANLLELNPERRTFVLSEKLRNALPYSSPRPLATPSTAPAALVFEDAMYQRVLSERIGHGLLDIIDCSTGCNPPSADVVRRTVAVVAALPRNMTLLSGLPSLRLYQSAWYFQPPLEQIPPRAAVAHYLPADWWNASSIQDGADSIDMHIGTPWAGISLSAVPMQR